MLTGAIVAQTPVELPTTFWLDLGPIPPDKTHMWHHCQTEKPRLDIGPRGKPTAITLSNGNDIDLNSNDLSL